MIQISPQTDSSNIPAGELNRQTKPEKGQGLGVFAKILAGLLRKTGEKDPKSVSPEGAPEGELLNLTLKQSESGGGEELAALFPDQPGPRKGKKPGLTGPGEPGAVGELQGPEKKSPEAAGELRKGEKNRNLLLGNPLGLKFTEDPAAPAPDQGEGAELSPETAPLPGENPGGREFEGVLAENPWGEAGEAGETRISRRGKAGDKSQSPGSPEGLFSSGDGAEIPEIQLAGLKKGETSQEGGDGPSRRSGESRSKDKRRDRINLEVRDLRHGEGTQPGAVSPQNTAAEAGPQTGRGEAEISLEVRGEDFRRNAPAGAESSWESRSGQIFEDILARELHQNLNGDIVRHASVVLRDGGEGTIRLSLKPESLGNVKIRLEMAENKITGHIVVESEEALRAFEREARSLEQAFKDSGFAGADLDMSLASGNGEGGREWGEETRGPFLSERMAASQYEAVPEGAETPGFFAANAGNGVYTRNGRASVNMLV